jgi:hypothetical protein
MSQSHWQWVPGAVVPTYSYRDLIGVYHRSHRGGAEYHVFPASLPIAKRTKTRALCVGGLPSRGLSDQLNARAKGGR